MPDRLHLKLSCAVCFAWLAACQSEIDPLERHSLFHDGIEREYFVHLPRRDDADPLPLVVALHGYTGTATGFAEYYSLNEHADAHGYAIVYPQGTGFDASHNEATPARVTSWNDLAANLPSPPDRPHCTAASTRYPCPPECGECTACMWTSCYDDLGFIDAMLDELLANYPIDASRVYLLGVSNGGMMTLRLGCSLSNRFTAVAPIIGQLAPGHACGPDTDLPMLHLAGGRDEVVRADGTAGAADGFIYTSVDETAAVWAGALDCAIGPVPWSMALAETAGLECQAFENCRVPGQEVVSCIEPDTAHEWPAQTGGQSLGMDLVWAFFRRYETGRADSLE